jgi:histidinol-phosphatase (PHP family)
MIANYHTHTFRCGHAEGNEADYAREAEKAGLKILGMADHTPYDFFDIGPRNRPMRMMPEELPGYADSVRALAKEYEGRMEILLGVEAEYYPKYFPRLLEMLRENRVQYMILGQHFLENEVDAPYCGRPWSDRAVIERYVAQSTEALQTRLFSYFAHPDLINFPGNDDVYEREIRRLCRAAHDTETPLEINLLGLREGRNYPDERFWRIAGEEGNTAILGCDAHRPRYVSDPATEARARDLAARNGVPLLDTLKLRCLTEN